MTEARVPVTVEDRAEFNINDHVWVKLTDEGRAYHRQWHRDRYPMLDYRAPDESDDGWSKWQLWCLMHDFGAGVTMARRPLFETTIRLPSAAIRQMGGE